MKTNNYHDNENRDKLIKLRAVMDTLPPFCKLYFRGIENVTSPRTRLAYAYDIRLFFDFLHDNNPYCSKVEITDFDIAIMDMVTREDVEEYMSYLSLYINHQGEEISNDERGKARKLASLRSFYNYYFINELIKTNPPSLVPMPKLHEKEIIRLDPNEVAILLDQVEDGTGLTDKQMVYHNKTKLRDLALLTLLLGTGIRVSECVGLDIDNVDFDNMGILIRRKGGYEDVVYFGIEVEDALNAYMEHRKNMNAVSGHENALFLSIQNKRLTVRSVEKLVKKYAQTVTTLKKITPHKLRSTYGTALYQETGDIYLVADVLGHKDVNTTRRHYAAMADENKRKAARTLRLREEAD